MTDRPHSGDDVAADCRVIEIHIEEISQLFDSMDPSPFHKKDLDRNAAEYIASSVLDFPRRASLALMVYADQAPGLPDEGRVVGDAVREHFARESGYAQRRLRHLLRKGWTSLAIGVTFLAAAVITGAVAGNAMREPWGLLVRESLLIGGWVAMWRPLETFLYDWWPIVGERRRYDRLSRMAVRIEYMGS